MSCEALRDLFRDDLINAEKNGEIKGEARGKILGAIQAYDSIGKRPSEIIKIIETKFNLKPEEAEKYMKEALGVELSVF